MHKYNAHGATDVTGFGILGHANNLASIQKNEVAFVIHNLPVIAKMTAVSKACGGMFGLLQGRSAETSGTLHYACYLYYIIDKVFKHLHCLYKGRRLALSYVSCLWPLQDKTKHSYRTKELMWTVDEDRVSRNNRRKHAQRY